MNPARMNSFIEASNNLKFGHYLEDTPQGFQTTSNAAKGISLEKIKEIAKQCLTVLKKEEDATKVNALVKGLKNLETQLKASNSFTEIYSAASKGFFPFDKFPYDLMTRTLEFESPQEWAEMEKTAHSFKASTSRAKVWEKEAKILGLEVEPHKAKESVLEFYHVLPMINDLLLQFVDEEDQKRIGAISDPKERFQEIGKNWKGNIPLYTFVKDMESITQKEKKARMHAILWGFRTGRVREDSLISNFADVARIGSPEIRNRLMPEVIKHLPQFASNKDTRILVEYFSLKNKMIDMDLAIRLVNKFDHISSKGLAFSLPAMVSLLFKKDPEKCKEIVRILIQKGDRPFKDEEIPIPKEMKKFIAEEVAKADQK